jgi:chemotaxis protein methyltransferase CheR
VAETLITPAAFESLSRLLYAQCGLVLEPGKEYLVRGRLTPIMEKHRCQSLDQLLQRIQTNGSTGLLTEVIEAMVTTETSFFRDFHPFETLRKTVLPALIEQRRKKKQLNIWCAASSSGQEPYSVALLIRDAFPELESWKLFFSATDLSREMLTRCRTGRYSQLEVNRGLPTPLLLKWFKQEGANWQIDDRIRQTLSFSQLNLTQPWPPMPTWDLVLMRNVMIYFDAESKAAILARLTRVLAKDGFLILGGAETTLNLHDGYQRVETLKSGFYQLKS